MTLNCELCQSEFSVLSGRLPVSSAHMWAKWLYSIDLMFCSNFSFTIFSLMLFPLFSKVFTVILKIYELPKIYNKIPKYYQPLVLTIIIFQAHSMSQFHLALNYTPINFIENVPWGKKTLLAQNFLKNPR